MMGYSRNFMIAFERLRNARLSAGNEVAVFARSDGMG
jgi:hypothetical protein